jgi:dipeptidyl aminopeptidase/acylaminoacyl peptidase
MIYIIIIILTAVLVFFIWGTIRVYKFLVPRVYLPHGDIKPVEEYTVSGNTPEKVYFKTGDGIQTTGLFYAASDKKSPCVLVAHGYASRMGIYPEKVARLLEKKWHVFTFDFRGHGESQYPMTSLALREHLEVIAAFEYLAGNPLVDSDNIAIWGVSMGAVASMKSVAYGCNPRVIIADSPFSDLIANFRYRLIRKKLPFPMVLYMLFILGLIVKGNMLRNDLSGNLKSFNHVPILFIHGETDIDVEIQASEKLHRIYKGPKEFLRLEGVGHYDHDKFPGYLDKSIEFLKKNLKNS